MHVHFLSSNHIWMTDTLKTNLQQKYVKIILNKWKYLYQLFPPCPMNFPCWRTFLPDSVSSYQFHSIYLANTCKSSIIFCGRKNLCHLISKGTVAEFTRRAWGLPGTFLLAPFSRNLLLYTSMLQYHSLKYSITNQYNQ